MQKLKRASKQPVYAMSGVSGEGIPDLMRVIFVLIQNARDAQKDETIVEAAWAPAAN